MKKKAAFISVVITVCFLGLFVFSGQHAEAKTKVLRLVVPTPAGVFPLTYKDEELAKRFNKRAKGEYEIKVFAGGALAVLPEYFDSVRIGVIEMADSPWGCFANLDPRLGLIESPFLFNNIQGGAAATKALLPLHDAVMQEKFNAKALGLYNLNGNELVSRKPVKTLEDWKGLLVGALSPTTSVMVKKLGASPVVMPFTDIYSALQKGVIDAAIFSFRGSLALGHMDVCSDVTVFYGTSAYMGYTINLDVWNEMPEHIQKILQEEIDWTVDWLHSTQLRMEDEDFQTLKKMKKNIHIVPAEEREKWSQLFSSYKEEEFKKCGEFGQKVQKIADDMNAQYPYTEMVIK